MRAERDELLALASTLGIPPSSTDGPADSSAEACPEFSDDFLRPRREEPRLIERRRRVLLVLSTVPLPLPLLPPPPPPPRLETASVLSLTVPPPPDAPPPPLPPLTASNTLFSLLEK